MTVFTFYIQSGDELLDQNVQVDVTAQETVGQVKAKIKQAMSLPLDDMDIFKVPSGRELGRQDALSDQALFHTAIGYKENWGMKPEGFDLRIAITKSIPSSIPSLPSQGHKAKSFASDLVLYGVIGFCVVALPHYSFLTFTSSKLCPPDSIKPSVIWGLGGALVGVIAAVGQHVHHSRSV